MDQLFHAVAIDGPSGAGKSTLARRVARELHFLYVDTGAIYRSIGWYVLQRGAALDNAELVAALLPDLNVEVRYGEDGLQHMVVIGQDVTDEIRSPGSICRSFSGGGHTGSAGLSAGYAAQPCTHP